MTDKEFWALIGLLDGVADEQSVARLAARLDDRAENFQRRVDRAVHDLDGARFLALPIQDVSDPDDADALPLVGTALESFLYAMVAAGPQTYQAVRLDPVVSTARRWSFSEADRLGRVYEEISGPDGWCRPLVFGSSEHWLRYADAVLKIAKALDAREDWRSWWAAAGRERLDLVIELTDEDTGSVRRSGRLVRADFRLPVRRLLHRPPGVAARIAAEDYKRAAQGVLVTTSWVGKASRDFAAANGRIEIIEGRNVWARLKEFLDLDGLIGLEKLTPGWTTSDLGQPL